MAVALVPRLPQTRRRCIKRFASVNFTASARLARVSVDFDNSQRADQRRRGVTAKLVGNGIADQIALARGVSPHSASNHLALAKALAQDLPCTFARSLHGQINEATTTGVAKQLFCLDSADRQAIDRDLASELCGMSAQRAERVTKGMAALRCPDAIAARARKAPNERRGKHSAHRRHDGLSHRITSGARGCRDLCCT